MLIDNSQFKLWQECPLKYYEKYVKGIELDWLKKGATASEFGTRVHQLLEEHYLVLKGTPREPYPEYPLAALELEAQTMFAQYINHFPVELFTVLDVEKTFRIPLAPFRCPLGHEIQEVPVEPGMLTVWCATCGTVEKRHCLSAHTYVGKIDVTYRDNETGLLSIMDHKTEKRGAYTNNPRAWAARTQGTLYLWAAPQIYGEDIRDLVVNVLKRQSDKGQIGPEFPERQHIQRSEEQKRIAVNGLIKIADEIAYAKEHWTEEDWQAAANRNECMVGNFECEFYFPHLEGWTEELIQINYRKTVPYLDL